VSAACDTTVCFKLQWHRVHDVIYEHFSLCNLKGVHIFSHTLCFYLLQAHAIGDLPVPDGQFTFICIANDIDVPIIF
jgi:hypothetical protein